MRMRFPSIEPRHKRHVGGGHVQNIMIELFFFSLYFWSWYENIYFHIFDIFDILSFSSLWYHIEEWSSSFTIGLTDWNYIYLHVHTQSFYGFQSLHHLHVIHEVQNTFDQILGWKKSFSRCPSAAPALWGKFLKESLLFIDHPSPLHTSPIFGPY